VLQHDTEPSLNGFAPETYLANSGARQNSQLDQRTALPDQCLCSAEADVRPPQGGTPGLTESRGWVFGRTFDWNGRENYRELRLGRLCCPHA
jgi:hypothetical protein